MKSCGGGWQQNWNYDDKPDLDANPPSYALRVYGGTMCMVGGAGSTLTVVVRDCDGSEIQKWTLNDDGTIRPRAAATLCLARADGQATDGTGIQLIPCVAGNRAQQWTWPMG